MNNKELESKNGGKQNFSFESDSPKKRRPLDQKNRAYRQLSNELKDRYEWNDFNEEFEINKSKYSENLFTFSQVEELSNLKKTTSNSIQNFQINSSHESSEKQISVEKSYQIKINDLENQLFLMRVILSFFASIFAISLYFFSKIIQSSKKICKEKLKENISRNI